MTSNLNYSPTASRLVTATLTNAQAAGRRTATTGDLLIAILQTPRCEAAAFMGAYGLDRKCLDVIEAQIFMSDETRGQNRALTNELAEVYRIAGIMPQRFGDAHVTDLHLLAAQFCVINNHTKQIFTVAQNRSAIEAMSQIGVDLTVIKQRLLSQLANKQRIGRLPLEQS